MKDYYRQIQSRKRKLANLFWKKVEELIGPKKSLLLAVVIVPSILIILKALVQILHTLPAVSSLVPPQTIPSPTLILSTPQILESPLERERIKTISNAPCEGNSIDVLREFNPVEGKEILFQVDENDFTVVEPPKEGLFQGSKRYPFECSLPFLATISATPRKDASIGVFLEFEEVFKVYLETEIERHGK